MKIKVKKLIFIISCVALYTILYFFLSLSQNSAEINLATKSNEIKRTGICDYITFETSKGWPVIYSKTINNDMNCNKLNIFYPFGLAIDIFVPAVLLIVLLKY